MRTATMEEWVDLVERLHSRGAPEQLVMMLSRGAVLSWHDERTGESLASPPELQASGALMRTTATPGIAQRSAPADVSDEARVAYERELQRAGMLPRATKRWSDMTYAERHALWTEDEDKARALRDADADEENDHGR